MGLTAEELHELAEFAALQEATNETTRLRFEGDLSVVDSEDERCGSLKFSSTHTVDWEYFA